MMAKMEEDIHEAGMWSQSMQEKFKTVKKDHRDIERILADLREKREVYEQKIDDCKVERHEIFGMIQ